MIYLRLWGGLGNQLFQYAFAYSMAKKLKTELKLDTSFYSDEYLSENPRFTKQKMMLENLNVSCLDNNVPDKIKKKAAFFQNKYINRIIRVPVHTAMGGKKFKYVKECRLNYDPFYANVKADSLYFDGYWQTPLYFDEYKEDLKREFSPKNVGELPYLREVKTQESVAIHIRRGDYVNRTISYGNLFLLPMEYYRNSINYINNLFENPHFYVFSNDIEWSKENLSCENSTFVSGTEGMSALDELYLMSQCKVQIISNSTFSWWAGYLNPNKDGLVIAPQEWFGNRDIIPLDWVRISK